MEDPFIDACSHGRIQEVQRLLSNVNIGILHCGLFETCIHGHVEILKLLLKDERVNVNQVKICDETPFFIACDNGQIEIVKLLLNDKRVNINTPNIFLCTFLHNLCWKGQIDILEHILSTGRDINLRAKEKNGKTAIDIAREGGYKEKEDWEDEESFQRRIKNCPKIVELLESFETNPIETRIKLRINLGFASNLFSFLFFSFYFIILHQG